MNTPNIAVIGAGYWGKNLVRNMAQLERLHSVCDASSTVRASVRAAYPSVRVTAALDDILRDPEVQGVMVVVPSAAHYEVALASLQAGKHTYVEKPIALDVTHGEALVSEAASRNLTLMVGHLLLFHPCISWLKTAVSAGELGRVLYMTCTRVNLGKVRRDENALWSLAPHDVSVILHLLEGNPVSVAAHGLTYVQTERDIEDVVFVTLRYADGRAAHIHVSWLDPHKARRLTIVGSEKMVSFDDMAMEKVRVYDKGVEGLSAEHDPPPYASYGDALTLRHGDVRVPHIPMREPLRQLCEAFLHSVDSGATPKTDGQSGVDVLRVLDAAQRSLKAGGQPMNLEGE